MHPPFLKMRKSTTRCINHQTIKKNLEICNIYHSKVLHQWYRPKVTFMLNVNRNSSLQGQGKQLLIIKFLIMFLTFVYVSDVEGENSICVMLNGEESELTIFKMNNTKVGYPKAKILFSISISQTDCISYAKGKIQKSPAITYILLQNFYQRHVS